MKKHLFLTFLLTLAAILTTAAQSLVNSGAGTPTDIAQKVRQTAEKHLGVFNSQGNNNNREYCDCGKCQKQKKSKKHDDCNQKGKHHGKHKNQHDKHSCSCDHNHCRSEKRHDCGDDDDRDCRNGRDCDDEDRYSRNGRNHDDDDRRYDRNDRDRDVKYGETTRPAPRKPVAKVKTRPTPTVKPAPKSSSAKKKATPRPVGK